MRNFAFVACLTLGLGAAGAVRAAAQSVSQAAPPSCTADWSCTTYRTPLGLQVQDVEGGGRYVTLEDGTVWEVELSDRATSAAWQAGDFVGVRPIAAPREDFDVLLTRVGDVEQKAAVRLAGRREAAFRSEPAQE